MEGFNLSDGGWSPYACDNMFDAVSSAELRELRYASSGWVELGSSIRQDLVRLPYCLMDSFRSLMACSAVGLWWILEPGMKREWSSR